MDDAVTRCVPWSSCGAETRCSAAPASERPRTVGPLDELFRVRQFEWLIDAAGLDEASVLGLASRDPLLGCADEWVCPSGIKLHGGPEGDDILATLEEAECFGGEVVILCARSRSVRASPEYTPRRTVHLG